MTDAEFIDDTAKLIAELYKEDSVGGRLHIVLDDLNLEDEWVKSCWEDIKANGTETERVCAFRLMGMTEDERQRAIEFYRDNYAWNAGWYPGKYGWMNEANSPFPC